MSDLHCEIIQSTCLHRQHGHILGICHVMQGGSAGAGLVFADSPSLLLASSSILWTGTLVQTSLSKLYETVCPSACGEGKARSQLKEVRD